jgi:hypothetical protein
MVAEGIKTQPNKVPDATVDETFCAMGAAYEGE